MQSIKGKFLLFTLCLSTGGIWAKPSSVIFGDVWGDLQDGGKSIIDGLRNITKDGTSVGADIFDNLDSSKGLFLNDIGQLGEDLSNAISESLTTGLKELSQSLKGNITALKGKVDAELNIIKKQALLSGLAALEELSSVADQLESALADLSLKLGETVNSQLNETLIELLEWGKKQLERVDEGTDGAGLSQANDIINLLIERYTKGLVNALQELEVLKSSFEMELNDKISEYSGYAKDLIDAMNKCANQSTLRCQSLIEESIENLSNAVNELQALLRRGNELIKAGVNASNAITSLLNQLAKDKLKVEKDLDDIINQNRASTASSSTSSGDSTVSDQSSPDSDETSTQSNGSSTESNRLPGVSAILGDLLDKLSASSKSLLGDLLNETASSKELLDGLKGDFVQDVSQLAQNVSNALSEALISGLADHAKNLQGNITDLEGKIKKETNTIKKKTLNNALTALKSLNSTVIQLQAALNDISLKLGSSLNSQIDEALDELTKWGEEQLDRVNKETDGAGLGQAVDIVKLLTERYFHSLPSTLNEFEVLRSDFELEVNNKIDEFSEYANALITNMNRCLLRSVSSLQCQAITEELVAKLGYAQNELQFLLRKSQAMLKAGAYATDAIADLLKQLEKDKLQCENYLNDIIEDNRSETVTETETTTSDNTATETDSTTSIPSSTTLSSSSTTLDPSSTTLSPSSTTVKPE